jgi:uncharacterized membrane protein
MPEAVAVSMETTSLDRSLDAVVSLGRAIFSLAIIFMGIETIVCARLSDHSLGDQYNIIPVIPWLPAIPWLGYLFGAVLVLCGLGLLTKYRLRSAAWIFGGIFLLCTLILDVPKNAVDIKSVSLRTGVFEPLSLACLAVLLARSANPAWLERVARYLLAISLVIFGVDHFLVLQFIADLLPKWIPWHVFWVAFFGAAFIATGISIALNVLVRWSSACLGLMFAIYLFTLHLPRVLGLYGVPGAPTNPNEWSSLLIAMGLWGGLWGLAFINVE